MSENKHSVNTWISVKCELLSSRLKKLIRRRDVKQFLRFILILTGLISGYAVIFQLLMAYEGQQHSMISGLYWTLSTMSTLGYGDISFVSDIGRVFSIIVLLSGMIFLLIILPFTFIEMFYEPWMKARAANQIPRSVSAQMSDHVILTFYSPVARALIDKLEHFNYSYIVVLQELDQVINLIDDGINAMFGELNDPDTWVQARVEEAAMVATTRDDIVNTSVVFTIRGVTDSTPVIATAREEAAVEVLKLAGCSQVLELTKLMAEALSRRIAGSSKFPHIIGRIDDLLIAEVDSTRTTLVGKGYLEAQTITSISIIGYWARGTFEIAQPESIIEEDTLLVIAGSADQFKEFNASFQAEQAATEPNPVIIIGGGRVGRSTAAALQRRGMDYRIVELIEERVMDSDKTIIGSGADKMVLEKAGIKNAQTVIITPRDDETNIYLTIFCRLLRPDIQIISRATFERNLAALHRAGCDIALSYASMGANALFNFLQRSDLLMIAEGLDVFKVQVPKALAGKTLAESNFRQMTHCSVIGIDLDDKTMTNPGPDSILPEGGEVVLIGTPAGEAEFLRRFNSESE